MSKPAAGSWFSPPCLAMSPLETTPTEVKSGAVVNREVFFSKKWFRLLLCSSWNKVKGSNFPAGQGRRCSLLSRELQVPVEMADGGMCWSLLGNCTDQMGFWCPFRMQEKEMPSVKECITKQGRALDHFSANAMLRKTKLLVGLQCLIKVVFSSSNIQDSVKNLSFW